MICPTRLVLWTALSLYGVTQGYVIRMDSRDAGAKHHEVQSNLTAEEFLRNPQPVEFRSEIEERDTGCTVTQVKHYYNIIGDGSPHQNYKIAQVANTLTPCPGTIASGISHTFGWSIGGGFNPGVDKYDFASVGFDVGESTTQTTTTSFNCDGNNGPVPGLNDICILHYTAVTAIAVEFFRNTKNCNIDRTDDLGPGVVYLPNANDEGSLLSRGTNFYGQNIVQCRNQAEREVDFFCGPPGGPEWWAGVEGGEPGPYNPDYLAQRKPAGCGVPIEAYHYT